MRAVARSGPLAPCPGRRCGSKTPADAPAFKLVADQPKASHLPTGNADASLSGHAASRAARPEVTRGARAHRIRGSGRGEWRGSVPGFDPRSDRDALAAFANQNGSALGGWRDGWNGHGLAQRSSCSLAARGAVDRLRHHSGRWRPRGVGRVGGGAPHPPPADVLRHRAPPAGVTLRPQPPRDGGPVPGRGSWPPPRRRRRAGRRSAGRRSHGTRRGGWRPGTPPPSPAAP